MALSSGAKAYELTGDEKYLRAIRNAWTMIAETQQYASGAWAPKETFVQPHAGELAASLTATHDHFETPCCFYAHARLARYLTPFTGDARYGDGLERVLLNTILGALDPDDDGGYFYYSDYHCGGPQSLLPAQVALLRRNPAPVRGGLSPQPLFPRFRRHLREPLRRERGALASQSRGGETHAEHAYPGIGAHRISRGPGNARGIRHPSANPGVAGPPGAALGQRQGHFRGCGPGTFATLRRRWRKGDTVDLNLPFSFRAVPVDDRSPGIVAVMRGPVMLTAVNPPERLAATPAALAGMRPVPGKPLEFDCDSAAGPVRMRPFFQVEREPYSTYFHRTGEA